MLGAASGSEGRGKLADRGCSVRRSHHGHGPGHIPRATKSARFLRFQGSVPDPGSTSFASRVKIFPLQRERKDTPQAGLTTRREHVLPEKHSHCCRPIDFGSLEAEDKEAQDKPRRRGEFTLTDERNGA